MYVVAMSFITSCVLTGETKLYKHPKADTLYLAIPSRLVQDSTFVFKKGERVSIRYDPEKKAIIIEPATQESKKKTNKTK